MQLFYYFGAVFPLEVHLTYDHIKTLKIDQANLTNVVLSRVNRVKTCIATNITLSVYD